MATKYNRVKITTPKGIAVYPRLNKPDTKWKAEGAYSIRVRLSGAESAPIIKQIDEMAAQHLVDTTAALEAQIENATGAKKVKLEAELQKLALSEDKPYRATLDADSGEETGEYEFNFKMSATYLDKKTQTTKTMKPQLIDAKGNDASACQVWGGSIVQVGGYYNPFYVVKTGVGVSLRMSTVRIVKLVTGGGNGGQAFDFDTDAGEDDFVAPAPQKKDEAPAVAADAGAESDEF